MRAADEMPSRPFALAPEWCAGRAPVASLAAQRGVGQWMGHSTTAVTELYAHLCAYDADINVMVSRERPAAQPIKFPALRVVD